MKLDTRNPFAAWGFEEEIYAVNVAEGDDSGIVELEEPGFINETVKDEAYNKVAEPIDAEAYSEQHTDQASFFTNDENMLPTSLANKAYGNDQKLQREYPAGEPLNYYGNEADDLNLYGRTDEDEPEGDIPADYDVIDDPEKLPTEDTESVKVAAVGSDTANALTDGTYYKELMVTEADVNAEVKYNAVDKLTIENVTVSGGKGDSNGKINYTSPVVEIKNVTLTEEETSIYNVFEGSQSTNDKYDGLHKLDASDITVNNPSLKHNVINVYTPAEGAVITVKDSTFNLNVENSNVLRVSNYLNAQNVEINFENVDWVYENDDENINWTYAGLVIYQAVERDKAYSGDFSDIESWKINFKDCKYNGEKVESVNFGEHNQVVYAYGINGSGKTDLSEIMTINFE